MKVILDTNFILIPFQFKVDIFDQITELLGKVELYTLEQCIDELKRLKKRGAIEMIEKFGVRIVKERGKADDALLSWALKNKAILATNDSLLRKKARKLGIPTLYLRKLRKLEVEGV